MQHSPDDDAAAQQRVGHRQIFWERRAGGRVREAEQRRRLSRLQRTAGLVEVVGVESEMVWEADSERAAGRGLKMRALGGKCESRH